MPAVILTMGNGTSLSLPRTLGRALIRTAAVVSREAACVTAVEAEGGGGEPAAAPSCVVARIARTGAGPIAVLRNGPAREYKMLPADGTPVDLRIGDEILVSPGSAGAAGRIRVEWGLPTLAAEVVPRWHADWWARRGRANTSGAFGTKATAAAVSVAATAAPAVTAIIQAQVAVGGGGAVATVGPARLPDPASPSGRGGPPAACRPATLLVLVGLPGSGKSTFSAALTERDPGRWRRVHQDGAPSGGKRATAVAVATAVLQAGRSVVLDRCNLTPTARADFAAAARAVGAPMHVLVLARPAAECARRVAARTTHEGGLAGPDAAHVVFLMNADMKKAALPAVGDGEGFASVTVVTNDAEASAAVDTWSEEGCKGRKGAAKRRREGGGGGGDGGRPSPPPPPPPPPSSPPSPLNAGPSVFAPLSTGDGGPVSAAAAAMAVLKHAAASPPAAGPTPCPPGDTLPVRKSSDLLPPKASSDSADGSARTGLPSLPPRKPKPGAGAAAAPAAVAPAPPGEAGAGCPRDPLFALASAAALTAAAASAALVPSRAPAPIIMPALPHGWPEPPSVRAPRAHSDHPVHALWNIAAHPGSHASSGARLVIPPPGSGWAPVWPCRGLVVLPDLYPKSRVHGLILQHGPTPHGTPQHLGPTDGPLVRAMAAAGRAWLAAAGVPPAHQRLGFHSVASMQPLHLHAMSSDLAGACLRTRKHYMSFRPPFFVSADDVAACLEAGVPPPYLSPEESSAALHAPIVCQHCATGYMTMAALKDHMRMCAVVQGVEW